MVFQIMTWIARALALGMGGFCIYGLVRCFKSDRGNYNKGDHNE
jgi:hypothetical protein